MSWVVGGLVAAAVLAATGPPSRPVGRVGRDPSGHGARARPGGVRRGPRWRHRPRPPAGGPDLALAVTEVAARLRGGAEPRAAWQEALGVPVGAEGPRVTDLSRSADTGPQAAAVVAAGRLAVELGAPLAPLLDTVGEQLAAQADAEGERRAALAGPRATARVLTGLPALGVVLGIAVGADPLAVLLDGAVGSTALGAGVVLVLAGRAWTRALTVRAAAAGRAG